MRLVEFESAKGYDKLVAKIAAKIERDCQPFLTASNNFGSRLYRGVDVRGELLIKAKCPANRKPRDSGLVMHKLADRWFKEKTGIGFRSNAVFCFGSRTDADYYGTVYLMIPIGNFDFCFSTKVGDMYNEFDSFANWYSAYRDTSEMEVIAKKFFNKLDKSNYQFNSGIDGFRKGIASRNEMMIHCKNYYLLRSDSFADDVIDVLRKVT